MGNNISTRSPTKKLEILSDEVKDFSATITNNVIAEASQNIVVNQTQNIIIQNSTFDNCSLEASQEAKVIAKQIASFKVLLASPKQVLKKLADGPNSILGQAFSSNSSIMKDFINTAKEAYNIQGEDSDISLKQRLKTIMKMNISQSSIAKATQNIFVNQTQNINLNNISCSNNGSLKFDQKVVIDSLQQIMFSIAQNSLSNDPTFRRAVRNFNGDYNNNLSDEQIDEGTTLPDVCFDKPQPPSREISCPNCEDCPICPPQEQCNLDCPQCNDYILHAKTLYYVFIGAFLLLILVFVLH
jgi:hypothetical protein